MDSSFSSSYDFTNQGINQNNDKPLQFFLFIILIIIFFIIVIPWDKFKRKEGMSNGTLTQLFAQDSQDVYLKTNIDKQATGNFDLYWNQPTRVANTFLNRGTPLPTFILPNTDMNPNPYPIVASNNYTDYILDKSDKIPNCPYSDLINKELNPCKTPSNNSNTTNKNPNKKLKQNKILPMIQPETQNYLNVSKENNLIPNPLLLNTTATSTTSVPTIPDNALPSTMPLPTDPNKPPNPYELAFAAKQVAQTSKQADNLPALTQWKPRDYLYQSYYDNLLYNKDCIKDPASCGGGAGGFRLGEDYVQATKAVPYENISGDVFYPDSYTGSYFTEPNFDIVRPIPFMPNSNLPPKL